MGLETECPCVCHNAKRMCPLPSYFLGGGTLHMIQFLMALQRKSLAKRTNKKSWYWSFPVFERCKGSHLLVARTGSWHPYERSVRTLLGAPGLTSHKKHANARYLYKDAHCVLRSDTSSASSSCKRFGSHRVTGWPRGAEHMARATAARTVEELCERCLKMT